MHLVPKCRLRSIAVASALLGCVTSSYGQLETRFTIVDSSAGNFVTWGLSDYTVSPDVGWNFQVFGTFNTTYNSVLFILTGPQIPGTQVDRWELQIEGPLNQPLKTGVDYSFQAFADVGVAALDLHSTGRADHRATGTFRILEMSYNSEGEVLSFAVDFTHYGRSLPENYAIGELRYNIIPEPTAFTLVGLGSLVLAMGRRTARHH